MDNRWGSDGCCCGGEKLLALPIQQQQAQPIIESRNNVFILRIY